MHTMKAGMRAGSALWMLCAGGALLLAACGSSSTSKCGPDNCQGCCTEEGLCATGVANDTCGQEGEQCMACPLGQLCVSGLCMYSNPGRDMTVSQLDMTVPQPDMATSTPDMATSRPDMARQPDMKAPPDMARQPDMKAPPDMARQPDMKAPPPAHIGDACSSNTDCAALGSGALCRKTTATGNGSYNGGYCTLPCTQYSNCPSGSTCTGFLEYGEQALCLANCSSSNLCRAGYACYPISSSDSICWINPAPPPPTPPTGTIGKSCTSDAACTSGYPAGTCFDGWPGGYCSGICSLAGVCAADALCLLLDDGGTADPSDDFYGCLKTCSTPGNGPGTACKSGYTCDALLDSNGMRSPMGVCSPKCTSNSDCSSGYPTCNTSTGNCCKGTDCV